MTKTRKCEMCHDRPGKLVVDPYQEELSGIKVKMRLCEPCLRLRHDDI